MSTSLPQAKRRKRTLESYFKTQQPNQIEETAASSPNPPIASSSNDRNHEVPVVNFQHEEIGGQRTEVGATSTRNVPQIAADNYTTSLERDPGLRIPIMQHPVGKRDEVRRAYLQMGRNVTRLDPPTRPEYTIEGFRNWHNVKNGDKCAFLAHMGKNGADTFHSKCVEDAENLMNPSQHISTHWSSWSKEDIQRNRLRLTTIIGICMWLAFQLCPFRGHDESKKSKNRGNFLEMVSYSASLNEKVKEAMDTAPANCTYTSPQIQKEILNIVANKVRNLIRAEIGDKKYCILVDESKDASDKEQMVLVLRFVDTDGFVQERFFDIRRVKDTCSLTLKKCITDILDHYSLPIENMRGQGYDGANNMSGNLNGLQSLFLKECKYAYYVHCFQC